MILVQTITQNRYTTYALALPLLYFTGYRALTNQINWVGNWPLWSAVQASEISTLELDRTALILSRLLALGMTVLFAAMTVRFTRRREVDATRLLYRLRPLSLFRTALALAPWAVFPLLAGIWLALLVSWGHEGGAAKKAGQGLLAEKPCDLSRCQGARYSPRRAGSRLVSCAAPVPCAGKIYAD